MCEKTYMFKEKQEKDILLRNLFFNAIHVLLDDVVFIYCRQSWIVLVGRKIEFLFDRDQNMYSAATALLNRTLISTA